MAITFINGPLNNYNTSFTGGTHPGASEMIHFSDWAKALDPWDTPFLDWIGYGPAINQRTFYFGQSYLPELETTVGTGGISAGATTLPVAANTANMFRPRDLLALFDTGTDDAFPTEVVRVTAVASASSLTVVRAQQGTTGTAFVPGDRVLWIGNAEAQNEDHIEDPVVRGDRQFNYFQRFSGGVYADLAAQNTPTYEHSTNPMIADFEMVTKKLKRGLERSILFNRAPQAGTPDPAGKVPSTLGGLDHFINTNVEDLAGAPLTKGSFDSVLGDLFKTVDNSLAKTIVMSYGTKALVNKWYNPNRMVTINDSVAKERVEAIETDFGTFSFMAFQNFPDGRVYILDNNEIDVHPYAGLDWHITEKKGTEHGADHDHKYISGDFSLSVRNEKAMAVLSGFSMDPADYPDLSTGLVTLSNV